MTPRCECLPNSLTLCGWCETAVERIDFMDGLYDRMLPAIAATVTPISEARKGARR